MISPNQPATVTSTLPQSLSPRAQGRAAELTRPASPESPTLHILRNRPRCALRQEPAMVLHVAHSPTTTGPLTPTSELSNHPGGTGMSLHTTGNITRSSDPDIYADLDTTSIPTFDPSTNISEFTLFLRLDSFTNPGLTEAQFRGLFTKCLGCGLFMTRRTADYHDCRKALESLDDVTGSRSTGKRVLPTGDSSKSSSNSENYN